MGGPVQGSCIWQIVILMASPPFEAYDCFWLRNTLSERKLWQVWLHYVQNVEHIQYEGKSHQQQSVDLRKKQVKVRVYIHFNSYV